MDRVKGISLLRNAEYIRSRHGEDALESLLASLLPETARLLRAGAVKSSWYDVEIYFDQLRGIAALFGGEDPSPLMQALGANSAELDLNSIYRFFLRRGNPGFVLRQGAVMWRNYYEGGKLIIRARERNRVVARLDDERTLPPLTCHLIIGWASRAMALSGGKDVSVLHPACRGEGAPACDFEGSWA